MFRKWRPELNSLLQRIEMRPEELLAFSTRTQGSFGFDSLLGWDSMEVGFSLNEHNQLKKLPTRPAVELLGAFGLQGFFPVLDKKRRTVRYATWLVPLLPNVARTAALGVIPTVVGSRFQAVFVSRGTFKGLDFSDLVQGDSDE